VPYKLCKLLIPCVAGFREACKTETGLPAKTDDDESEMLIVGQANQQ
jgi:hypothetical protein